MLRLLKKFTKLGSIIGQTIGASLLIVGCSKLSNGVSFDFTSPHAQDFAKSQIISNGPAAADGTSQLLVVIQLMNSDNTAVVGYTPQYQVISGSGVTSSPCTASNSNGVSTCVLKSVQAGTKVLAVTNITIVLQASVVFSVPAAGQTKLGLVSSSKTQTQGAYSFTGTAGVSEAGVKKTSGTYTFYGSVQGEEFSR